MGKYFVSVCLDVKVPRWVSKWARDALGRGVGGLSGGGGDGVAQWSRGSERHDRTSEVLNRCGNARRFCTLGSRKFIAFWRSREPRTKDAVLLDAVFFGCRSGLFGSLSDGAQRPSVLGV